MIRFDASTEVSEVSSQMPVLKTGSRLRSAVCSTEVMLVKAPATDVVICCGGVPMLDPAAPKPSGLSIAADSRTSTALGKRYVNPAGDLELLCTKPGEGSLAVAGVPLALKEAKALPSSD
jgi:hypothetical protein